MLRDYEPDTIEKDVQNYWKQQQCFTVSEDLSREKFYCLSMLPYPSGDLHVGHVRNYTIGDVISRYQHMRGKNVLQPMGWDAFGLPAENAAIKHEVSPAEWTQKNISKMKKQLQRLGFAFDWKREISTCDPDYYQWEQWLFIQLYKKGLVYKKTAIVNWDPVDKTVLANEQVVDGCGWRSGAPIERREIPQWFFKITDYAEELLADLDKLTDWPPQVVTMQRNWIGRSDGAQVHFKVIKKTKEFLEVFTTRPDTLMGATYLCVAPQHPLAIDAANNDKAIHQFIKNCNQSSVAEAAIATQDKKGIFSGVYARHPITKEKLPIWIANYVLMDYGSGAVMAVPAHDQRDFEFATTYELPIQQVIATEAHDANTTLASALTDQGTLINSGKFDGLSSESACKKIVTLLKKEGLGSLTIQYRLRDWGISRQRYWGTPIPMIQCKHCGDVPVSETDLPVRLPLDVIPTGEGSPLHTDPTFYKVKCPDCGKSAKRDTDTMDTFVESSWYYLRYCSYNQDQAMLDNRAKYWTPVDFYIGGIEHAILHLLYSRFMHKILRDEGLVNSDEPFKKMLTQGMVLNNGVKMSKSKGNTVSPMALIKKYGADTLRLFQIFAAPPEQSLEWSEGGVEGAYRFLKKLWQFSYDKQSLLATMNATHTVNDDIKEALQSDPLYQELNAILKQANYDMKRVQLNTVVSATMKILNLLSNQLDTTSANGEAILQIGMSILLRLLAPIAPHITHQLWNELEYPDSICNATWPKEDSNALEERKVKIIIQVNGKLRATLETEQDASESSLTESAKDLPQVKKHLDDKSIKKIIFVPNKLINIVAQ